MKRMKRGSNRSVDDGIHHVKKKKSEAVFGACVEVANNTGLYQNKLHKCEFCDKVSGNKYTSLIHNARHIIIPLMKQTYYQCPECLHHYQSLLDLNQHISIKHLSMPNEPVGGKTIPLAEPILRNVKTTAAIESTPQEIDKKLDALRTALISLKKDTKSADNSDAIRVVTDNDNNHRNIVNGIANIKQERLENDYLQTPKPLSIKNRLVFEDDEHPVPLGLNSDNLLNDLTVNCTVNLELFDAQLFANSEKESQNVIGYKSGVKNGNSMINGDNSATIEKESNTQVKIRDVQEKISEVQVKKIKVQVKKSEVQVKKSDTSENANRSVHYEELMYLGQFSCAFCSLEFPNRYEKIIHETSHLNFQKKRLYLCSLCDRFICHSEYNGVKALRQHKLTKHNSLEPQRTCNDYCQYCGLRYFNYTNHYTNYHLIYVCPVCTKRFVTDEERKRHMETHESGAAMTPVIDDASNDASDDHGCVVKKNMYKEIVQICDLCVLMRRKTYHVNYKILGAMEAGWQSVVGFTCQLCHGKCSTLKIVEKTTFTKKKCHVPFKVCGDEDRKKVYVNNATEHRRGRKPLSNMERLKNIRHRLKMMSLH